MAVARQARCPSVTKTISSATTGAITSRKVSALTAGRTARTVAPPRSATTSTGTCSSDRPRLLALPPLRRALRSRFRAPFRLSGTQVSSASTMPVSLRAFRSFAAGNRCRQRKAVLTASPQRSAEARTVSPSARQAPKESHLSLRCRPDKGVPVAALNVFLHSLHWYRRRPLALPRDMAPGVPQCGHWRSSTHGRFNGSQRR